MIIGTQDRMIAKYRQYSPHIIFTESLREKQFSAPSANSMITGPQVPWLFPRRPPAKKVRRKSEISERNVNTRLSLCLLSWTRVTNSKQWSKDYWGKGTCTYVGAQEWVAAVHGPQMPTLSWSSTLRETNKPHLPSSKMNEFPCLLIIHTFKISITL